ncbi:MAG: YkgJ family cysteine cluster protein [Candidatus Bathyarchaeota archaeon]|nr:YkgJ family cysteine cluster protein [Candidatus Bathyarchaeota archaeon]
MGNKSPLEQIFGHSDFKPFAGPRAFRVLKLAKSMLKIPPVEEEAVLKAVSSLGVLLEMEVAMIFAMQNFFCTRCGDCCRNRGSICVSKQELERISEYKRKGYKKLKEEIRAFPLSNGTFRISHPCKFLIGNECSIYPVRPSVCQSYPASEILKSLAAGGGNDRCPIDDKLLAEIVVKRVFEERLFKDKPEELEKLNDQRRKDLAALASFTATERLSRLTQSYSRYLRNESLNAKNS